MQSQGIPDYVQRSGSIMRGHGPPMDTVGAIGNVYIDVDAWQLYAKRQTTGVLGAWGPYLLTVPTAGPAFINMSLKYYGEQPPYQNQPQYGTTVGAAGDYYLMWGPQAAGVIPRMFGPKQFDNAPGWPESGWGPQDQYPPQPTVISEGLLSQEDDVYLVPTFWNDGCLTYEGLYPTGYGGLVEIAAFGPVDIQTVRELGLQTLGVTYPGTLNSNWNAYNVFVFADGTTIGGDGTAANPLKQLGG